MSEREQIEAAFEAALAPMKTAGTLKTVLSVGGEPFQKVLKAALAARPFAMIKYTGKEGAQRDGGQHDYRAVVTVLMAAGSEGGLSKRRATIYQILQGVENALAGQVIADGYSPLEHVAEEWSEVTEGQLEVWVHRYAVNYSKQ